MADIRTLLERGYANATPPPDGFERMLRRRDRRRRNQRIAAGVVGIAVFVAAVWIVTNGLSFDRARTPAAPGPKETGPAETGPLTGYTGDPFSVGFGGLPPESATPSEPFPGEAIWTPLFTCERVPPCQGPTLDFSTTPVRVYVTNLYTDGRLVWAMISSQGGCCRVSAWIEQRLTPMGVKSMEDLPPWGENPGEQLPVSAWEDVELRPYVPQRYAILPRSLGLFPAAARDLLRGTETFCKQLWHGQGWIECFQVTIDDARALAEILGDAGFEGPEIDEGSPGGLVWDSPDGERIQFVPILPNERIFRRLPSKLQLR
jgi:hypothetical protein